MCEGGVRREEGEVIRGLGGFIENLDFKEVGKLSNFFRKKIF